MTMHPVSPERSTVPPAHARTFSVLPPPPPYDEPLRSRALREPDTPRREDPHRSASEGAWHRTAFAGWGVGAVVLLFGEAIARLGTRAYVTLAHQHDVEILLVAAAIIGAFCYVEGYRGLQLRFAPRVAERVLRRGRVHVALAPLYVLGLVGGDRRSLRRAWMGVGLIGGAILAVRALPPLWRGIVDGGVSAALLWGLVAILYRVARAAAAAAAQRRVSERPRTPYERNGRS